MCQQAGLRAPSSMTTARPALQDTSPCPHRNSTLSSTPLRMSHGTGPLGTAWEPGDAPRANEEVRELLLVRTVPTGSSSATAGMSVFIMHIPFMPPSLFACYLVSLRYQVHLGTSTLAV